MDCYAYMYIWLTKFFLQCKLPLIYIRFLSRDLGNYSGNYSSSEKSTTNYEQMEFTLQLVLSFVKALISEI